MHRLKHTSIVSSFLNILRLLILYSKKECPLCKIQLRTKRETRFHDKLKNIMVLLKDQIENENSKEN